MATIAATDALHEALARNTRDDQQPGPEKSALTETLSLHARALGEVGTVDSAVKPLDAAEGLSNRRL